MLLFSDSRNEGVQQRETSYLRCRTQCQFASWLMTGGEPDLMANPDQRPRLQCFSGVHPAAMASPSRESRPLSGEPAVHHFVTGESADYWMYFRKEALNVVIEPALYFVRRRNDNGCCTLIQFKLSPYAIILTLMIIICNKFHEKHFICR